ncbi:DUF998 domain-containing protein [Simiduia curdlanivorans]|uniref:DUF998 domain-containing protein n=1 Tax=Simiduia curdlanivorans TaxID=1492769 RepID=A0ABV8V2Z2_9GAMM|nr:DUF998 domain-containing protein [Simiduia curdlanivorans]MDN3640937.1 DUF998 domain-containing protein [Simiduia curdlanivorans]
MNERVRRWCYFAGLLAPVWLVVGVMIAGMFYPGYSHYTQAMSELGAKGAPTHILSPLMNNYPLGVLFTLFGLGLVYTFPASISARLSGVLIIIHGLSSCLAGFFSCDVGCDLTAPSDEQNLHNLAGFVMFLSLLLASFLWVFIAKSCLGVKWFGWFSLAISLIAIALLPLMASAVASGDGFGLYQRLSYGSQALWVLVFSALLLEPKVKLPSADVKKE